MHNRLKTLARTTILAIITLAVSMATLGLSQASASELPINIVVEKSPISMEGPSYVKTDTPPVIVNGRTLVPVRAIAEALGYTVTWNEQSKTATLSQWGVDRITFRLDSTTVTIDGKTKEIDVPAQTINNRIMVPLRVIGEATGYHVNYAANDIYREVYVTPYNIITTFPEPHQVDADANYIAKPGYTLSYEGLSQVYHVNNPSVTIDPRLALGKTTQDEVIALYGDPRNVDYPKLGNMVYKAPFMLTNEFDTSYKFSFEDGKLVSLDIYYYL